MPKVINKQIRYKLPRNTCFYPTSKLAPPKEDCEHHYVKKHPNNNYNTFQHKEITPHCIQSIYFDYKNVLLEATKSYD